MLLDSMPVPYLLMTELDQYIPLILYIGNTAEWSADRKEN